MQFLFVTDIHEDQTALEWLDGTRGRYDAVFIGGDVTSWGRQEFLTSFFARIGGERVYLVQGNHEPRESEAWRGVRLLHGTKTEVGGLVVGGLAGSSPTPFGTPFELGDAEASSILGGLGAVDVLVSHCPPFGTKCDLSMAGRHIGSRPVMDYVRERRPRLVLSGHVHESSAEEVIDGTRLVNPGPLFEGNYAVFDEECRVVLKKERLT